MGFAVQFHSEKHPYRVMFETVRSKHSVLYEGPCIAHVPCLVVLFPVHAERRFSVSEWEPHCTLRNKGYVVCGHHRGFLSFSISRRGGEPPLRINKRTKMKKKTETTFAKLKCMGGLSPGRADRRLLGPRRKTRESTPWK